MKTLMGFFLSVVIILTACRTEPDVTLETVTPAAPDATPVNTPSPMPAPEENPTPTAAPTETAAPSLPRFEAAECQFSPSRLSNVTCGYLTVPENRSQEGGGEIKLHVAIADSYSDDPEPDPLIYLSGGPGSHALRSLYYSLRNYADILKKRDVIFFDPRGVGFSEPSLGCPEVVASFHDIIGRPHSAEELIESSVLAYQACRERLESEGIDLSAYNSAEMAADVNDLRRALGYEKVNLFGLSYGTRTAQTVMRDFPHILRSVALDSVVPVEADLLGDDAISAQQALNRVFERCAAEEFCNKAYPDLPAAFDELARQLDANPITIPVRHLITDEIHDVWVDGSILGASLVEALYNQETAVYIPKLIYDSLAGEDPHYETLATSLEIYLLYGDVSSAGMRHSVLCSDEGSFTSLETALENTTTAHPAVAGYFYKDWGIVFGVCDIWEAKVANPIENQPVLSDIPTLVLSGEYDPVTPPAWGKQVADTLENAAYVEFPGLSHFVFAERDCARDITAAFLNDPDTPPDSNCVNFIRFDFVVDY